MWPTGGRSIHGKPPRSRLWLPHSTAGTTSPGGLSLHDTILADNPIAYWRMDSAQAAVIPDETEAINRDLTGNTWVSDINRVASIIPTEPDGGAVHSFASGARLDPPSNQWFVGPPAGITFESWFIVDSISAATGCLLSVYNTVTPALGVVEIRKSGSNLLYQLGNGAALVDGPSFPLAVAELVHGIWGWNGTHLVSYKNGVKIGEVAFTGPIPNPNLTPRFLNRTGTLTMQWLGTVDSTAIYLHWIGEDRVAAHYAAGMGV